MPASPDLGGGRGWDGCCKHIHVQIVLLQGCLQRLSSGSRLNCLQISLFLDTCHYPTFPTHLVCFLRACKDILCEISFFWLGEWSISLKISSTESVKKFHVAFKFIPPIVTQSLQCRVGTKLDVIQSLPSNDSQSGGMMLTLGERRT